MGLIDTFKFLTEPADSEDFGKDKDAWKASKEAKKAAKDAEKRAGKH